MMQCKEQLFTDKPHICIREKEHDGLHHTYTVDGRDIYWSNRKG